MTPEQLKNLTPAPWEAAATTGDAGQYFDPENRQKLNKTESWALGPRVRSRFVADADAAFIVLSRHVFEIMRSKHWGVRAEFVGAVAAHHGGFFWVAIDRFGDDVCDRVAGNPFDAVLVAHEWLKERKAGA